MKHALGGGGWLKHAATHAKKQHRKAEAPRHANGVHALGTNGEVSLLGPCVNSPHNTTTRLGTMWAARLLIPHKSASSTVFYRLLLSACTKQVDASLPTPLTWGKKEKRSRLSGLTGGHDLTEAFTRFPCNFALGCLWG